MNGLPFRVEPGAPSPRGARPDADGVNFSLFSQHATGVELLLFTRPDDPEPAHVLRLDAQINRTFHFWHVYVRGLAPGVAYAYRVEGPDDLHGQGHRFDPAKVLLDPYGRGLAVARWERASAMIPGDNVRESMRSVVTDTSAFDWEGDRPLRRPLRDTIIYELHVGGFTRSATAGSRAPGTFAGLVEKVPYLLSLGVTAVELLPVFAFDATQIAGYRPSDGQPLHNFWGYDPIAAFTPHPAYAESGDPARLFDDFRAMVKALHRAGLEVLLDVVFNHTGELDQAGPVVSFKGLDNSVYYYLNSDDRALYRDYSACGNTLNCNHPVVAAMVADCLEFWVREGHVDGFRFDQASILARGPDGQPMAFPPLLWQIELSESLAGSKIIAEAWDAGGLYQVGEFPGYRWAEWNGRFRDDMRRFVRGDGGLLGAVAARLAGSADLYHQAGRLPINSVNFITCHDGFTLHDLVSYERKHNTENGQDNLDGANDNFSANYGVEGETDDSAILTLRERQIKNCFVLLLLSQGVPMLLAGDEVMRSQGGNNNGYTLDDERGWFDWRLLDKHASLLRFVRAMIAFRMAHPNLRRRTFFTGLPDANGRRDVEWHGPDLAAPRWDAPEARALACVIWGQRRDDDLCLLLNMDTKDQAFTLPRASARSWRCVLDTALASPDDIAEPGLEPPVAGHTYLVRARSAVVLIARRGPS